MSDHKPIPDENRFTSRFVTRIHILDIGNPPVRQIQLLAPKDPDALLDDPVTLERYRADDYLPYWPIIWPSGLMLAERILRESGNPPEPFGNGRCIELGCGLGTTGICAGLRGWHVTFTDYDPEAVDFAGHNALRNGVPAQQIRTAHMDWRKPLNEKFSWVVASDVLYERRLHPLLLGAIDALLAPGGVAWVSDPQRTAAENFPINAVEAGFKISDLPMTGRNFNNEPMNGTLYVLQKTQNAKR